MNAHDQLDALAEQAMKIGRTQIQPYLDAHRHDPYECRVCGRVYLWKDIPRVQSLGARGGHPDAAEPAEFVDGCECGARESFDPVEGA